MTNNDWRSWPQLEFDIEQFDDVQDWVVNRFGDETREVILVGKGRECFHIAIQDPKVLNVALLKFSDCILQGNEYEKREEAEQVRKTVDIEVKKLITELQQKLTSSPYYDKYVKEAAAGEGLFSFDNGVWTNVKE